MNIRSVTREHLVVALQYCLETFGYSKYHGELPKIIFREKGTRDKGWGGYQPETNEITIYKAKHKSVVDLMDTLIHEYTHYLQNLTVYERYQKKYGYLDNPHEEEAQETASQHKWLAKRYVMKQLR